MNTLSSLKIVEIGGPFIKDALPDQTTFFSTGFVAVEANPHKGVYPVSMRTLPLLARLVRDASTSLVVCHPTFYAPWHWRWLSRALFDRRTLQGHVPIARMFGPQVLRLGTNAPIAVLDLEDLPVIQRSHVFLLDRSRAYFKRELPPDYWRLFLKTTHANLPTPRFRRSERQKRRIEKIRPISLGLPADFAPPPSPEEKTTDIFFAGQVQNTSFVRERGSAELMTLRADGYKVDISDRALSREEFYARCARAWLVWSPEGLGWDCFRHYEAAACGSVPVINQPTIERHEPLRRGEHAIYYDVEPGALSHALVTALADKSRLQTMTTAARAHVLRHHTRQALARYVIETALDGQSSGEPVVVSSSLAVGPENGYRTHQGGRGHLTHPAPGVARWASSVQS